jgi:general stress protein 26
MKKTSGNKMTDCSCKVKAGIEEFDMMRSPEQTIGNLIDKQKTAFVASVDGDGFPNMKAMLSPRKRNGICEFWFTTNTSSKRVAQYRMNPKALRVQVAYESFG